MNPHELLVQHLIKLIKKHYKWLWKSLARRFVQFKRFNFQVFVMSDIRFFWTMRCSLQQASIVWRQQVTWAMRSPSQHGSNTHVGYTFQHNTNIIEVCETRRGLVALKHFFSKVVYVGKARYEVRAPCMLFRIRSVNFETVNQTCSGLDAPCRR